MASKDVESAGALENLVNAYIARALNSPEEFEQVSREFGGLPLRSSASGIFDRARLADAVAAKVLGPGWYYEVLETTSNGIPSARIVITGRS
jgi:hypothetical protein